MFTYISSFAVKLRISPINFYKMSSEVAAETVTRLSKKEKKLERKIREKIAKKERRQEAKRRNEHIKLFSTDVSDYYFSNGFRKVYPYHYTYRCFAKRRWLDRAIAEVLKQEFNCNSYKSFDDAIREGLVKVNDAVVDVDYTLKDGDRVSHTVHRHELPVLDMPIETVFEDEKMFVISKPPSLPIHPCGQYNLNSLVYILAKEHGRSNIRSVHRLDRMTSGLMLFCKDHDTANRMAEHISQRQVKKTYLSLVDGKFPDEATCEAPLGCLSPKFGLHRVLSVDEGGKPAETVFRRRHYDASRDVSIVECHPRTGRTHQIRIHLQFLGFPIKNDSLYNCDAWGPSRGRAGEYGVPVEQIIQAFDKSVDRAQYLQADDEEKGHSEPKRARLDASSTRETFDEGRLVVDESCIECATRFRDPSPESLFIFLHAFEYEGPDWKFTTAEPWWAT